MTNEGIEIKQILKNPGLVKGKTPDDVKREPGWEEGTLLDGSRKGQGWTIRERDENGNLTGRVIVYHPGGGHHGPDPYWTVSSGQGGTVRIFPGGRWNGRAGQQEVAINGIS